MPDNQNPYMDPMNPNGYVPNYPQGYGEQPDPYMQQGAWNQGQFGMPQQGYADDYLNPENMMSPTDIYANQAVQMGSPYGAPAPFQDPYADPNAAFMDPAYGAQQFQDPYGQPSPYGQPAQPYFDPMQPQAMPGMGQMGAPYGMDPSQSGQMPPVGPGQTGGFDNPMQQMGNPAVSGQFAPVGQQMGQMPMQDQGMRQMQPDGQQAGGQKRQKQPEPTLTVGAPVVDPSKATNGRATLALILSILGILLSLLPPIGLVLAIIARRISKSYTANGGRAASGEAARVFSMVALAFAIFMCAILVWILACAGDAWDIKLPVIGITPISFFSHSPLGFLFPH